MSGIKKVKDIMISITNYPHVPNWFSINKAVKIIRVSLLDAKTCPVPMVLLVFDEKYDLMGTVSLKDILNEIENTDKTNKSLERPVSDIMTPAKTFVLPDDTVDKAASVMNKTNVDLLPVQDSKKKFVGIVIMKDIFAEMSNTILNKK